MLDEREEFALAFGRTIHNLEETKKKLEESNRTIDGLLKQIDRLMTFYIHAKKFHSLPDICCPDIEVGKES